MSVERVYLCDWRDCDSHTQTASDALPVAMIAVTEGDADRPHHFCGWDCLLKFAAEKPPEETISCGESYSS